MLFFHSLRPRRFHHEYVYVDKHKELLNDIEQRVRRELSDEKVPGDKYREGPRHKISDLLKPEVLRHRGNRLTAVWMSLILSAGVIALLILFLFIAL